MFTRLNDLPTGAIGVRASGTVTCRDSAVVLEPSIRPVLDAGRQVRLLYIVDHDFAGYDPNVPFDEAVFGTQSLHKFERIAFLAEDGRYSRAVGAMEGLIPADIKLLPADAVEAAKAWLAA